MPNGCPACFHQLIWHLFELIYNHLNMVLVETGGIDCIGVAAQDGCSGRADSVVTRMATEMESGHDKPFAHLHLHRVPAWWCTAWSVHCFSVLFEAWMNTCFAVEATRTPKPVCGGAAVSTVYSCSEHNLFRCNQGIMGTIWIRATSVVYV